MIEISMAAKDLFQNECGVQNPIARAVSSYAQAPKGMLEGNVVAGASQQMEGPEQNMPTSFNMQSLVNQLPAVHEPSQLPSIQQAPDLNTAENWASSFSATTVSERPVPRGAIANNVPVMPTPRLAPTGPSWASDYLDQHDSLTYDSVLNVEDDVTSADRSKTNLGEKSALRDAAAELASAMKKEDKFKNSEFLHLIDLIGQGSLTVVENELVQSQEEGSTKAAETTNVDETGEVYTEAPFTHNPYSQDLPTVQPQVHPGLDSQLDPGLDTRLDPGLDSRLDEALDQAEGEDILASEQAARELDDLMARADMLFQDEYSNIDPSVLDNSGFMNKYDTYKFSSEPVSLPESLDALSEGRRRLVAGDLAGAVVMFETAVQQQPDNSLAWQLLGTTQAENEQEPAAIAALKRCLSLDPSDLTCRLALAVSFTNEGLRGEACAALYSWLEQHPAYRGLVADGTSGVTAPAGSYLTEAQFSRVRDLFITAANERPTDPDPDVQMCLGVLFNIHEDYNKAADCFRAALKVRNNDAELWNRLGATLANGGKSEEAISAYDTALKIQPGYIRCRYNLGIACIQLKAYREAAEHLVTCLSLQNDATSATIWSTLRLAIGGLNDAKLRDLVDNKLLGDLMQEFHISS